MDDEDIREDWTRAPFPKPKPAGTNGIAWIRDYRNKTGLGLRESKAAWDTLNAKGVDPWDVLEVVAPARPRENDLDTAYKNVKLAMREVLDEWFNDQDGKEI